MADRNRDWDDDEPDARPRYRPPSSSNSALSKVGGPSIFLLVVAILQTTIHLMGVGSMLLLFVTNAQDPDDPSPESALVIFLVCAVGLLKDFFVIRGVVAMRTGRGYGWAIAGAVAGCIPDAGCLFSLIAAIWCLTILNDPRVRRAFDPSRYDDRDDEDDF